MATLKGANVTKASTVDKISQGEQGGKLKMLTDSFTQTAATVVGDVIQMGLLPAGAKVHTAVMEFEAFGACDFSVGWQASASGDIIADPNGFIPSTDVAADGIALMSGAANNAGYLKTFDEPVMVIITAITDDTTSSDKIVTTDIGFTLD